MASPAHFSRPNQGYSSQQERPFGISWPLLFGAFVALLLSRFNWPWKWLLSGAPILTFAILLGASRGQRILPSINLWTLVSTLNLVYSVAATSWLLHGAFLAVCYPTILITCLSQSAVLASFVRRLLRRLIKQAQFINDSVALFDLPALEIDVDVEGLMVIRGVSLSLSSLTLVAHGVEVGIKLSDDMELAIQVETVTVALFRSIAISDVYANIKGGEYEMTFGNLDTRASTHDAKEPLMISDSAMLKRAATTGSMVRPPLVKMTSKMTGGAVMSGHNARDAFKSVTKVSGDKATNEYNDNFKWIKHTNMIHQCREAALQLHDEQQELEGPPTKNDIRAAVATMLHKEPSIRHPPSASVKVTTLRDLSSPSTKRFMHRLPMLLRLLLSPLSYFHPVSISAITAAGSGKWITSQLERHVFKDYTAENAELRRLERRILSWLSDASFVFTLDGITGVAQVPFLAHFDIASNLAITDVLAYRTIDVERFQLKQVIRLGGADARFSVPSLLLPHHEHLLPPKPTPKDKAELADQAAHADGQPKTFQKEHELAQAEKDEVNVKIAVHARLPACFDQELLNFVAALVKATKVVELEREADVAEHEVSTFKDFAHQLNKGMKDGMKKVVAEGIVNDRWIAKMVGKITKQLETAQGEVGYSGDIPVALGPYRLPEGHIEMSKILA